MVYSEGTVKNLYELASSGNYSPQQVNEKTS